MQRLTMSIARDSIDDPCTTTTTASTGAMVADEVENSERVWQEIRSVLRNSQPDQPVAEWADASTEFRIGDGFPIPNRAVTPPPMTQTLSSSCASSASSESLVPDLHSRLQLPLSSSSVSSVPLLAHSYCVILFSKSPCSVMSFCAFVHSCIQFNQRSVGKLIRACCAGDLSRVMAVAGLPRVGVCCIVAGSFDTPLHV